MATVNQHPMPNVFIGRDVSVPTRQWIVKFYGTTWVDKRGCKKRFASYDAALSAVKKHESSR